MPKFIRRRYLLAAAALVPAVARAQPQTPPAPTRELIPAPTRELIPAPTRELIPAPTRELIPAPTRELIVDRRTISIGGRAATVYRLGTSDGASGLILDPGERFRVRVRNRLDEPTIVHWHGQTPPAGQDGVADMQGSAPGGFSRAEALIPPRGERDYDFAARPGTHWMHSHHGLQAQRLLAAPLIVRDADAARRDEQDVVLLLQDFSWRDPKDILAGLGGGGPMGHGGHAMPVPRIGGPLDLNDVLYDAFLANDRTLADPQIVRVERGARVRLRVINAASTTQFWLDLGALEGTILATDGNPINPVAVPDRKSVV